MRKPIKDHQCSLCGLHGHYPENHETVRKAEHAELTALLASIHRDDIQCGWCGDYGHTENQHPEALADIRTWQREAHNEQFPFGDHVEVP